MFKIGDKVSLLTDGGYTGWPLENTKCYGIVTEVEHPHATVIHLYAKDTGKPVYITGKSKWIFLNSSLKLCNEEKQTSYAGYAGYKIDLSWIKGAARLVLSKAIQEKALNLGYVWSGDITPYVHLCDKPYLYFTGRAITHSSGPSWFERSPNKEVSVNNWLEGKIPELKPKYTPKKGDAVLGLCEQYNVWRAAVFQKMSMGCYLCYGSVIYKECIPFDEKLVNTTKERK